jgi:histidine triad (HIT) family protein
MPSDFYCDEVLSGKTPVTIVDETEQELAFHHTRPAYEQHIVVIPKKHVASLLALDENDAPLLLELLAVVRLVAAQMVSECGACRVITNLGDYQDSKHLHWHVVYGKRI